MSSRNRKIVSKNRDKALSDMDKAKSILIEAIHNNYETAYNLNITDECEIFQHIADLPEDKVNEAYKLLKPYMKWEGDIGGVHPLCFIVEDIQIELNTQKVGVLFFKRNGSGFINRIELVNSNGADVSLPGLAVMTVGNKVYDFTLGYFGLAWIEYMKILYKTNDILRLDYTLSKFLSYEKEDVPGVITLGMCDYLKTREGLSRQRFEELIS